MEANRHGLPGEALASVNGPGIYVSKSDLVAATLRELIVTGTLLPGVALRQRELADRFGVSPTPVREALRRLESEGLVTYDTHKGSTVTEPHAGAIAEKYQIRAALEGLAAKLAAPKVTEDALSRLEADNERLLDLSLPPEEVSDLNRHFHFSVYEMAGSPVLLALMRLLWQSFPGGPQLFRPRQESIEEHRELLDALRARDAQRAQEITERHILGALPHVGHAVNRGPAKSHALRTSRATAAGK